MDKSKFFFGLLVVMILSIDMVLSETSSKLGLHTSTGSSSWSILNSAQMRVLKLLDSFGSAETLKQQNPSMIIIGRIYLEYQPQNGDPQAAADLWWSNTSSIILSSPGVDYWEGYNEPDVSGDQMSWYASFEVARTKILAQHNLKAVVGCFGVGTPDVTNPTQIEAMYPMIDAAIEYGGILGLHEYNAPFLNVTFSGSVQTGSGWLIGRYRMLYNQFLIPTGRKISLAITETGIDAGLCSMNGCNIPPGHGWKSFCSLWGDSSSSSPACINEYMSQLEWYDSILRSDDYVLGATIFCIDIGGGWGDFDIAPLAPNLITYFNNNN